MHHAAFKLHIDQLALLENPTYISGLFFYLYRVFYTPVQITTFVPVGGTNRYKCPLTGPRRCHLLATWYKCHTFVPGGGFGRYKCEAITFVPVVATDRYRVLLWTGTGVQRLFSPSFPPCPSPPPHSSSSSLQLELPLPNGTIGSFCSICDDFSTI
jgi:hypothetical protein